MKKIALQNNVTIFYITADSFPDGVAHAWRQLHKMVQQNTDRTAYGVSYKDEQGAIVYNAGMEELFAGEGEGYGCETMVIPKGTYLAETIPDFPKKLPANGHAFAALLARPDCDADTLCVEWYISDSNVVCMVRQNEMIAY